MHEVVPDSSALSPLIVSGAAGPGPLARSSAPQACPPGGRIWVTKSDAKQAAAAVRRLAEGRARGKAVISS
jgi:hypothetical protein